MVSPVPSPLPRESERQRAAPRSAATPAAPLAMGRPGRATPTAPLPWPAAPRPSDVLRLQRAIGNRGVQRLLAARGWRRAPIQRIIIIKNSNKTELPEEEEKRLRAMGFTDIVIATIKRLAGMELVAQLPEMTTWVQVANWLVQSATPAAAATAPSRSFYPEAMKEGHAKTIAELLQVVETFAKVDLGQDQSGTASKLLLTLAELWRQLPYRKVIATAPLELATAFKKLTVIADGLATRDGQSQREILTLVQKDLNSEACRLRLATFQTSHREQKREAADEGDQGPQPVASADTADEVFAGINAAYLKTFTEGAFFAGTLNQYLALFAAVKGDNVAVVQVLAMFSEWYKNLPVEVKGEIDKLIEDPLTKEKYDQLSQAKQEMREKNQQILDDQAEKIALMKSGIEKRREVVREKRKAAGGEAQEQIEKRLGEIKLSLETIGTFMKKQEATDQDIERALGGIGVTSRKQLGPAKGKLESERKGLNAKKLELGKESGDQEEFKRASDELKELERQVAEAETARETFGRETRTAEWQFENQHQLRRLHNSLITSIVKNIRNLLVHNLDFYTTAKSTLEFLNETNLGWLAEAIANIIQVMLGQQKLDPHQVAALQKLQQILAGFGEQAEQQGDRALLIHRQLASLNELARLTSVVPFTEHGFTDLSKKSYQYAPTAAPLAVGKHVAFETKGDQQYVNVKQPRVAEESGLLLAEEHDIVRYLDAIAVTRAILRKLHEFMQKTDLTSEKAIESLYQADPFAMIDQKDRLIIRLRFNALLEALGESIRPIADRALDIDPTSAAGSEQAVAALLAFIDALRDFRNSSTHGLEWKNSSSWIAPLILLDADVPDLKMLRGQFLELSLERLREQATAKKPETKGRQKGSPIAAIGWINYQENQEQLDTFLTGIDQLRLKYWLFVVDAGARLVVTLRERVEGESKGEDTTAQDLALLLKALTIAVEARASRLRRKETVKGGVEQNQLILVASPFVSMLLGAAGAEFIDRQAIATFGRQSPAELDARFLANLGLASQTDFGDTLAAVRAFCDHHGWKTSEEAQQGGARDIFKAAIDAAKLANAKREDDAPIILVDGLRLTPILYTIEASLAAVWNRTENEPQGIQLTNRGRNLTVLDALIGVALAPESASLAALSAKSGGMQPDVGLSQSISGPSSAMGQGGQRETTPHGNCLYEGVNIALDNPSETAEIFRELATAWLMEGRNAERLGRRGGVEIDELINVIVTPGQWAGAAGDLAPAILATVIHRTIVVVTMANTYAVVPLEGRPVGEVVVYYRDNHYTVQPPPGMAGLEKRPRKSFEGSSGQ